MKAKIIQLPSHIALLFCLSFLFLVPRFVIADQKQSVKVANTNIDENGQSKGKKILKYSDLEIDGAQVINEYETINKKIIEGKEPAINLGDHAMNYEDYSKHPQIELETRIARAWFKKMSDIISKLQVMKYNLELLEEEPEIPGNLEKAKDCAEKYKEALKSFKKIADNPTKVSSKKKR